MTIDNTLVNKLSKLSSIKIEDNKKEALKAELGEIVNFIENLNEIDVSSIDEIFSPIGEETILREDVAVHNKDISSHIIHHAPKSNDGYFIVPQIIE
ncbi:Aspartyl-tRNA(Asn) amidotransferase subunit C @ Glutamyl-tRNA(Gln) amidotransferase subunit C [hydrothermal vent metagenome]|uniref:Aspartyl-tRNA(Asn) amidotransferase subunit C @ Glutamyl-tRNA(Gln) amidotransferase subunit C n=1 Tax=hydrothermal vent metagenome TaxID=652676 RepID=A0A3B1E512_9ZZZZ